MSTDLHVLAGHQIVLGWWLVLNYMQTPPTHYYLESSGRAAYMETHPSHASQPWCPLSGNPKQAIPLQCYVLVSKKVHPGKLKVGSKLN